MHSRHDRRVQPFGKRRPQEGAAHAGSPAALSDSPAPDSMRRLHAASPLAWALRLSVVVGLFGVLAVTQLARLSGPDGATARLAFDARPVSSDPETTGAILPAGAARAAQAVRLDPCVVPATSPLRP